MKVFPAEDSGYGASGCNYTERRGGKTEEVSVFTESLVALVNCGGYRDLGRGGGERRALGGGGGTRLKPHDRC